MDTNIYAKLWWDSSETYEAKLKSYKQTNKDKGK